MAQVVLRQDAEADLKRLDRSVQARVVKKLELLGTAPEMGKPLRPPMHLFRRVVVGDRDWRIVYHHLAEYDIVLVWCIGKRAGGEVYEESARRVGQMRPGELKERMIEMLVELGRIVQPPPAPVDEHTQPGRRFRPRRRRP